MKGFFIPLEFGKLKLTQIEEKLLATYRYYTIKGDYHHCALTNKKLAEILYVNERSIKRSKKKLKDLGYIKTNGGTRVWYVGIDIEETETVDEVDEVEEQVEEQVDEQVNKTEITENEEVDEQVEEKVKKTEITENEKVIEEETVKTDIVKPVETDIVMEQDNKTNFDKLVEQLPDEYKHEEMVKYLMSEKSKDIEYINSVDFSKLNTKMYLTQFKTIISNNFNVYGGSEEEESDLKKEFFSNENEMTENEKDKELLDWISNLTLEPQVEYGKYE